jgi:hypothetical protein
MVIQTTITRPVQFELCHVVVGDNGPTLPAKKLARVNANKTTSARNRTFILTPYKLHFQLLSLSKSNPFY